MQNNTHPSISAEEIAETVGNFASGLLHAFDARDVAHVAVNQVSRSMGAEIVYLSLLPPAGKRLDLVASVGMPSDFVQSHHSVPLETGFIAATALRTGELQQIPKIEELPNYEEFLTLKDLARIGIKSFFAMPLLLGGEKIGVLSLARNKAGYLTPLELKLYQSISTSLAYALKKAQMRELERKLDLQLKAIREAILSIDLENGPTLFLKNLVTKACEFTQARYGALGILNENGNGLADFIAVGVADDVEKQIGHLPEGKGLLGAVIRERRAIRVSSIANDPRSHGFPPHHPPMTTFLGIPLRIGQKVFGNFYLTEKVSGQEFTQEDENFLELFGAQASLAIAYAHQVIESEKKRKIETETFRELEHLRTVAAAIASHDLKNPIQAIRMQIELLRHKIGKTAPPWMDSGFEKIDRSISNLIQLSEDLFDASRIETKNLKISPKPLDLKQTLPHLIDRLKPTLGNHPIHLVQSAQSIPLSADLESVDRIFSNLLVNAAKYSEDGKPISIHINPATNGVEILVRDQGPGISQEDLPHIFERFYQCKESQAKKQGLGLGLFIVHGLVEAHGGKIWAESTLGQGSVFHVWLPQSP